MADDVSLKDMESADSSSPAQAAAVVGANENPDKAAQSHALSQQTGVPSSYIDLDQDGFVQNQKQQAAGAVVANSPRLQTYINNNPIAAKVSNDDYTNLDDLGETLHQYPHESDLAGLVRGFREGFDYPQFEDENRVSSNPVVQSIADQFVPLLTGSLVSHTFGGVIGSAAAYLSDQYSRISGDWQPSHQADNERQLRAMGEWFVQRGDAGAGHSFISDGVEPPDGISPAIDAVKAAQNTSDHAQLAVARQQTEASLTRPRAPDLFRDFAKQETGDQYISINGEGVQQLYGNKVPEPGDQMLGFVPDIHQQMLRSAVTGGDIHVPLADWLTYGSPWLDRQLADFIRTRPGNVTSAEAMPLMAYHEIPREMLNDTGLGEGDEISEEAVLDDTLESLRKAAGLPTLKAYFERAKAIGLTEDQLKRWAKLIDRQQQADFDWKRAQVEKMEKKRQSAEWKDNRKEVRKEVVDGLKTQPNFVADALLRNSDGPSPVRIDPESIRPEQREGLPNNYFSRRNGVSADRVADLAGFETGDDMLSALRELHANRGSKQPEEWRRQLIEDNTDRIMEERYGNLDRNIVASVYDHMFSETALDLMHQDIKQMMGGDWPISREEFEQGVKDQVDQQKIGTVKSSEYIRASRKLSPVIDQLIRENPTEAIKQQQKQFASVLAAKYSLQIEKEMKQFAKFAKTWKKDAVSGVGQEYTNHIQSVLRKLGLPTVRSADNIAKELRANQKTLNQFIVEKAQRDNLPIDMPDYVQEQAWNKPYADLSVQEFHEIKRGLDQMAHYARDENKVTKEGEKVDFEATRDAMIDKMQRVFGDKPLPPPKRYKTWRDTPKNVLWSLVNMERMGDRLDDFDPKGLFNQFITRVYTGGATERKALLQEFNTKILDAIGPQEELGNLRQKIPNDFWQYQGQPLEMTRENVLTMLNHMGNDSNWKKLTAGYKVDPEQAKAWILGYVSQDDVDRAQRMGEVFNDLFERADQMQRRSSGVGIDKIALTPRQLKATGGADTPRGRTTTIEGPNSTTRIDINGGDHVDQGKTYKGWYYPVDYDPRFQKGGQRVTSPEAMLENEYFRPATSKTYSYKRTDYIGPLSLDLNHVETTMRQMIHDIAMREPLQQVGKFFQDQKFRLAVEQYAGKGFADALNPFLHQMANTGNMSHPTLRNLGDAFGHVLSNMTSGMIQFNPGTVIKHGTTAALNSMYSVGPRQFAQAFTMMTRDTGGGQRWAQFAMDNSELLRQRHENFAQVMAPAQNLNHIFTGKGGGKLQKIQHIAAWAGSYPIATFDLLSAIPTWIAKYQEVTAQGMDHGQAVFEADKAVRLTHGSTDFLNKPPAMHNQSPIVQSFMKFYTVFNEIFQNQYTMGVRMKQAYKLGLSGDALGSASKWQQAAGMFATYVLMPAAIEEAVDYDRNRKESLGHHVANIMLNGVSAGIPFARDVAHGIERGDLGEMGLIGEMGKVAGQPLLDVIKGNEFSPAKTGLFLKHLVTAAGLMSGLPGLEGGNLAEFTWNYFHGRDHADNLGQIYRGLTTGSSRLRH